MSLHMLFWIDQNGEPHVSEHQSLDTLLKESEELHRSGARFVCSATEDPNRVGAPGFALAKEYTWYKRRLDPATPLGRPRRVPKPV